MSRYNKQLIAPGMSSGRSRGSSLVQGGFSSTTQTTTVRITTTNTIHHSGSRTNYPTEYTPFIGGSSCAHEHPCLIDEEDYDSDSSDYTVVGRFSNIRLGGRTDSESTVRGPRVIELSDSRSRTSSRPSGSHYSTSSRTTDSHHPTSRTSHHPSESRHSTSRPTDSHRRSTQTSSRPTSRPSHHPSQSRHSTSRPTDSHRRSTQTSSRPSESHYSSSATPTDSRRRTTQASSRSPESQYQSSRPTGSYQPSSRTSHRPSESRHQSSRPTESHRRSTLSSYRPSQPRIYEEDREVTVYGEPSSNEKGSTDKAKSSRRESKALKGIKALVKHVWSVGKWIMGSKERWVIGKEFKKVCI